MITTWEEFFSLRNGKSCVDVTLKIVFGSSGRDGHQWGDSLEEVSFGHDELQSNSLVD